MNKIKRELVEELLQARKKWSDIFAETFKTSEENDALWKEVLEKRRSLQNHMEDMGYSYAEYCLVESFTEACEFADRSMSRLLKCLEVCGIEVVEE